MSLCPICHDPSCLGNECSPPLDEWEMGNGEEVFVIESLSVPASARCPKCGSWLHKTEESYGCIMCQAEQLQRKCAACDGHGCTHVNGYKLDTCQVCEGTGLKKPVCRYCGTEMGINPQDGKLGCPHIACCYIGEESA